MLPSSPLIALERPVSEVHDLAALDLDGVVYIGRDAVPGAAQHLQAARESGLRLAYVTNNAARVPHEVGEHLRGLGVLARDEDVVTSAQAAATVLAEMLPEASRVYLIGGAGLELALRERGLVPVTSVDEEPVAVVQGYGPEMPWKQVVAGAVLVRRGLVWVASNTDMTIPTPAGIGPGNGSLVELVARFAEREPVVAGKPEPALLRETASRTGAKNPVMVGDRLDTDIEGAARVGWPSLLVMTGVTHAAELVAAPPEQRPSYLAADLAGLLQPHPVPTLADGVARLGGWEAQVDPQGRLLVAGAGNASDWWRVVAVAGWAWLDQGQAPADTSALNPPVTSTAVADG